jgi:hypothetical protein
MAHTAAENAKTMVLMSAFLWAVSPKKRTTQRRLLEGPLAAFAAWPSATFRCAPKAGTAVPNPRASSELQTVLHDEGRSRIVRRAW